jgi:predicted amino acid dehydrogenase
VVSPFVFEPRYDPNVAMQRWKCLLLHDADARFAEDLAVLATNQLRDEVLAQRLKQCRIHKYLYSLSAEHGSACTYTTAIEEQLIAEGLSPAELAGVRRKIERAYPVNADTH